MNIDRRSWLRVLSALLVVLALGCGGSAPQWQVVSQATPNPLVNVKSYLIAPVTFEGFTFNGASEADWLATRTPEQRASWENDKVQFTSHMLTRFGVEKRSDESFALLAGSPAPGQFVLSYNIDARTQNGFVGSLRIRNAAGQVVDEIHFPARGGGSIAFGLSIFNVGTVVDTLTYLRSRYRTAS